MTDISTELLRFREAAGDWTAQRSMDVARNIAAALDGVVDWDADAGENWARVVRGPVEAALIAMGGPLVVGRMKDAARIRAKLPDEIVLVLVEDLDEPELAASPDAVTAAFPESPGVKSVALDPAAFSALDLWFATV